MVAPTATEALRVVAPLSVVVVAGAGAPSSDVGPSAGPPTGVATLPGAGGDETSSSAGEAAGVTSSSSSSLGGGETGVVVGGVGGAGADLGACVGGEVEEEGGLVGAGVEVGGGETGTGAAGEDDGVVGGDCGVGETVGEVLGVPSS